MNQTSTVVVLFADLVESTALMAAIGDDESDRVRRELFTRARAAIDGCRGTLVKTYGDGLMAVFPAGASDAVRCAESLRSEAHAIESPRALQLRVGIAAGEASEEDGDWFGTPVVEASRLAAAADPDEVLLSETARKLIGSRGGHEFTDVGRLTLKGLAHPLPTYALGTNARKRRERHRGRWVAAGLVVVLVATGLVAVLATSGDDSAGTAAPPVAQPKGYTPKLKPRACTDEESAGDPTVTCQMLVVPENRERPKGRQVELPVVRAPATSKDANKIPMVVIGFNINPPAGDPLRAAATQIRLGLRGREGAEPSLDCDELDASRSARLTMAWRDARAAYQQDLRACLDRLQRDGVDLSAYDNADVADDLRDLVVALGVDRVTVRTVASAGRAISVALRRYPGIMHGVIMTNPNVPPSELLENVPTQADESLALLADRCAHDTGCAELLSGRDLVAATEAARTQFATAPQTVIVGNSPVLMDDGRLMQTLYFALAHTQNVLALVPSVVASGATAAAASYLVDALPVREPGAPEVVEWCAESAGAVTRATLQAEAQATPRWESLVDPAALDDCGRYGLARVPDLTTFPTADVPVFVVHGVITPWAPTDVMAAFGRGLGDYQLLSLPNEATGVDSWPDCAYEFRDRFTRDPSVRLDTKSCAAQDPPIPFAG